MKSICATAFALALLATSPLEAQGGSGKRDGENDPVEVLLDLRRELHLTREQVTSLREIQHRLEEANSLLLQQVFVIQRQVRPSLVGFGGDSGGRSLRPTPSQLTAARVPLEQIRENNLAAMAEVNAVLTADQKRRATVLLEMREHLERRTDWARWRRERDPDRD